MKYDEIPDNMQQKCLCVFVLDVSGSMRKDNAIGRLNDAIRQFYDDIVYGRNGVSKATVGRLEVAIVAFDQEPKVLRPTASTTPLLPSRAETPPVLTSRGSTTDTVKALDAALDIIAQRKRFYDRTGQTYHRPWIVLMTDGRTSSDPVEVERIERRINEEIRGKHLSMIGVAVGNDVPMAELNRLCGGHGCALEGLRFGQFFQWLSNSLSAITQSNDNGNIDIATGADDWMRNYQI